MRGFLIILIGSSCFLGSSYLHAKSGDDDKADEDDVAGLVLVGFGIYYLVVDRPKNEKDELLKKFKEGKGLQIYNTNKFSIEIPSPNKPLVIEPDSFFTAENKKSSLLEFKYKFN